MLFVSSDPLVNSYRPLPEEQGRREFDPEVNELLIARSDEERDALSVDVIRPDSESDSNTSSLANSLDGDSSLDFSLEAYCFRVLREQSD